MDCVKRLGVMCKFMCQLDWTKGWPDIRSNIILSVSVKRFMNEPNICIGRPSKKIGLSNLSNQLKATWLKKADFPSSRREPLLPDCLRWDIALVLPLDSN